MNTAIPNVDPMPLPAPYWLFKVLLVLMFILHIVAMNFMFGGGILAAVARFKGKKDENYLWISQNLTQKITSFFAATITLGVAALLFVQVIYGQFFYTSSVLMAWPWFLVIILLIFAYYGFYLVAFKKKVTSPSMGWILVFSLAIIFVIGFFYSNNMTLMLKPENWFAKYQADPSGWNLNWGEPTLIPRFLHFFVASIAIGGVLAVLTGLFRWKRDESSARRLISYGGKWFLYATMVQILVGIWFLLSLPKEKMMLFMGKHGLATGLFVLGIIGAILAIVFMAGALRKEDPRAGARRALITIGVVVVFMAIMRDILREAYISGYYPGVAMPTRVQWSPMILFFVLFLAGVVLWVVMLKRYFFAPDRTV